MPPSKKREKSLCVIVTGISGAGKSQVIKCLEDFGFFCVDNLPEPLLAQFADLISQSGKAMQKVAVGLDIRERRFFQKQRLSKDLSEFKRRGVEPWILFIDADDPTILRRYSETRRKHPLGKGILEGIIEERKALREARARADRVVETSNLTLSELKEIVLASLPTSVESAMHISLVSFGYKYGIPSDSDMVWDVRFMPNPHYVPALRKKTGLSADVKRYVMKDKFSRTFADQFFSLINNCLPHYSKEGKSYLTIAVGCTGGHHRSVTIAELLGDYLRKKNYPVSIRHRDLNQG